MTAPPCWIEIQTTSTFDVICCCIVCRKEGSLQETAISTQLSSNSQNQEERPPIRAEETTSEEDSGTFHLIELRTQHLGLGGTIPAVEDAAGRIVVMQFGAEDAPGPLRQHVHLGGQQHADRRGEKIDPEMGPYPCGQG